MMGMQGKGKDFKLLALNRLIDVLAAIPEEEQAETPELGADLPAEEKPAAGADEEPCETCGASPCECEGAADAGADAAVIKKVMGE